MAVWGTPTATEDDAERAVRAALDLVAAVSALGDEVGAPELRARAGVLTGEAAVTIGAEGQGMVAGDLVNTASRVQSAAEPGMVFVGESTRRSTEQTIVYEDAGVVRAQGQGGAHPALACAARRLRPARLAQVAGARSAVRRPRPRAAPDQGPLPLLGGRAARRTSSRVTGIAGIGKSRLSWEFYKYFDGIADTVYWHRGRCLSYGEGVTYWALADMVRMRCRISEEEEPASALSKLHATLEEHFLDAEERSFLEPRLAHLLGLAEHQARDQQDLFAAWRLFFERLSESYPTVLAFEDMQWADASLLDFVEYLLDWSRSHPIFVVTLARPELMERRPTWGAGQRSFTSLYLEPLSQQAMEELLAGLVPGLPAEVRDRILARAEGIPLYAVETVRMLLDRGLLVQDGPAYRLTGEVEALEVPETLHALIAARLDGLSAEERRLLQDAAVLGKTFTRDALAALSGSEADLEPVLVALARKEVLGVQADPRSPEHGQYGFLQDLVRHVAYETLSKKERRARHLAAAAHLSAAFAEDEDEVVEVIASHYLAAYEAAPDADDAGEIKRQGPGDARARRRARRVARRRGRGKALLRAGGRPRGRSLRSRSAAPPRGRHGRREPATRSPLGASSSESIAPVRGARRHARRCPRDSRGSAGSTASRAAATRPWRPWSALSQSSRTTSRTRISRRWPHDLGSATGTAPTSSVRPSGRSLRSTSPRRMRIPRPLVVALRAKSALAESRGHHEESLALQLRALQLALEHEFFDEASTCYFILSDKCFRRDEYNDALGYLDEALALARGTETVRRNGRPRRADVSRCACSGRWDEAQATRAEFTQEQIDSGGMVLSLLQSAVEIQIQRGELDGARQMLLDVLAPRGVHATSRSLSCYLGSRAALQRAEGRLAEALADAEQTIEAARTLGVAAQSVEAGHRRGDRSGVRARRYRRRPRSCS